MTGDTFVPQPGYSYIHKVLGKPFRFLHLTDGKYIWQPDGDKYTAVVKPDMFYPHHVVTKDMDGYDDLPHHPGEKLTNPGNSTVEILHALSGGFFRAEFRLPTGRDEIRVIELEKLQTFLNGDDADPSPIPPTPEPAPEPAETEPALSVPRPVDGEGLGEGLPDEGLHEHIKELADTIAARDIRIAALQEQIKHLQERSAATRQVVLNGGIQGNRKESFICRDASEAEYTRLLNTPRTTITLIQFLPDGHLCIAGYTSVYEPVDQPRSAAQPAVGGMTALSTALSNMVEAAEKLGAEVYTGNGVEQ